MQYLKFPPRSEQTKNSSHQYLLLPEDEAQMHHSIDRFFFCFQPIGIKWENEQQQQ